MAYINADIIHSTLRAAIDYYADAKHDFAKVTEQKNEFRDAMQAEGDEEEVYIYCDHCNFATADIEWDITRKKAPYDKEGSKGNILGYHIWQSFKPGEVTAAEAHQIGKEFAEKEFGGKYSYIVTTHLNTNCYHNHIAFCSVDYVNHRKFPEQIWKAKKHWRESSDEICRAHGLSIIIPSKNTKRENKKVKEKKIWRDILREDIDKVIPKADSFEEFLEEMHKLGYEVKVENKYVSFRNKDMKRFMRLSKKTLGEDYTEDALRERIITKRPVIPKGMRKFTLIINIESNIKYQSSYGLKNWAEIHNLQEASKALNFLVEHNAGSYEDIDARVAELKQERTHLSKNIKDTDRQIHEAKQCLSILNSYNNLKKYAAKYNSLSAKEKKIYRADNWNELQQFEILGKRLREIYPDGKLPSAQKLQDELSALIEKRQSDFEKDKALEAEISEFETMAHTIKDFMRETSQQELEHSSEQTRGQSKNYTHDL